MRVLVIGIGSNSLRMLVADVDLNNAQFRHVERSREGLRVFAALDDDRNISREMMEKVCANICAMISKARAYAVEKVHIFATSAVRDANNRGDFCNQIYIATGIIPVICSGELEATLYFLGATGAGPSGLIDIGGGSTEIVIGNDEKIQISKSFQIGAVRLLQNMPISNAYDANQVVAHAKLTLVEEPVFIITPQNLLWVGVGGTLTTVAALEQNISWTQNNSIQGFSLTQVAVRKNMEWLAAMEIETRTRLRGMQYQRADIVVHGLAILLACLETFHIDSIVVSEYGNLEGFIKHFYLSEKVVRKK